MPRRWGGATQKARRAILAPGTAHQAWGHAHDPTQQHTINCISAQVTNDAPLNFAWTGRILTHTTRAPVLNSAMPQPRGRPGDRVCRKHTRTPRRPTEPPRPQSWAARDGVGQRTAGTSDVRCRVLGCGATAGGVSASFPQIIYKKWRSREYLVLILNHKFIQSSSSIASRSAQSGPSSPFMLS